MKIAYITNADAHSGVGSRATAIRKELEKLTPDNNLQFSDVDIRSIKIRPFPGVLGSKSIGWIRAGRKYAKTANADVFDITNQSLSFLAKKLPPAVVTVHDIIEITDPQDSRAKYINAYTHSGISRAKHVITVSEYTKRELMREFSVPSTRISVIPNGVGSEFYPIDDFANSVANHELRRELKIQDSHPVVLYVGSDHARKNVPTALKVFAQVKKVRPDAVFIKVGLPGIPAGRVATLAAIHMLGIRDSVRILGNVSTEKLNHLYNLADVLLFPSLLEGFGLPPLQAMAAGLPVVCSNTTSLPEVVGDAAMVADPHDIEALVNGVRKITEDKTTEAEYRRRGLMRTKTFSWEKAAQEVLGIYKRIV